MNAVKYFATSVWQAIEKSQMERARRELDKYLESAGSLEEIERRLKKYR